MTKTIVDQILEGTIGLLQKPGAWRQGSCAFARNNPYGVEIDGTDTDGWCVHGAVTKTARTILDRTLDADAAEQGVMSSIRTHMGWESNLDVHQFNDAEGRTLEQITEMLRGVLANSSTHA